jgi:site-specific recombinase XerC
VRGSQGNVIPSNWSSNKWAGRFRSGTYNNGQPYVPPRGRSAPRQPVEDRLAPSHAVIDLPCRQPSAAEFLQAIVRELKIRFYRPKSIKSYRNALANFLRGYGAPPHALTREDVRDHLEMLVDGGGSSSWVSIHLSAIRTSFDKMCGQSVTLGLETPRKPKRLPVVLSVQGVKRLLESAPSLRDKLLLGMMYATGVRVSDRASAH